MENSTIKFGVCGCGHIGKRHAAMIQKNSSCELVALCDTEDFDEIEIADFGVPFFSKLEQLLSENLEIDVVNICSPNGLHAEHAIRALNKGKHVLIEKPMTLTADSAKEIIKLSNSTGKKVFCVMQNRYSPPIAWLKTIIDSKKLGEIFLVQVDCYWNRDDRYYFPEGKKHPWHGSLELDGGVLFTQFSHFVDLVYWLFGGVKDIKARFADFNHKHSTEFEDSGIVNFEFEKGGLGLINYSTAIFDKNLESSIKIIGSKGTVKIGGQYMNKVDYCHIQDYVLPNLNDSNPANDYGDYKGSANNHPLVFENVVDVLKSGGDMTTNMEEGMKVVEIIERIYAQRNNS